MDTGLTWITENWGKIAALWLVIEQILASSSLKSNSTFQLMCNLINTVLGKKAPQ